MERFFPFIMANLEENIKLLVKKLDCGKVKICATGKAEGNIAE